ncbi:type 1 glutamine amidotransferase (plasmid) [Leisingera aquaemixtae]|uniref:type 1 glutamine amidotransferase n=1 Tax=Leisingera aquaemixtae TaxID=1396826 RepID=UPI0039844E45
MSLHCRWRFHACWAFTETDPGSINMRLCILEADTPAPDLLGIAGTYADMFVNWLQPSLPEAEFFRVSAHLGDLPGAVGDHDGYLITGSLFSAYQDLPWIHELKAFVRRAFDNAIPIGGVCFGHQLMAEAMGGQVALCNRGWAVGKTEYQTSPDGAERFGQEAINALSFHRDQIVSLPAAATPLAGNSHCPWAALAYGDQAFSVQFHPEFSSDYMAALIHRDPDGTILPEQAALALKDMTHESNDVMSRAFAQLFRDGCRK